MANVALPGGISDPTSLTSSSASPSSSSSSSAVSMNILNQINSVTMDMLTTWNDSEQKTAADNQAAAQQSGTSNIQDASNVASAFPMLMLSQILLNTNNTASTSAENASQAQSSGVSSVASDVPVKDSAAVYAFLMSHTLEPMISNGSATSQQVISNWANLGQEQAISSFSICGSDSILSNAIAKQWKR